MNIIEMSEESETLLSETLDSTKSKVILDFYANWCAPCKSFAKMANQLTSHENLHDVTLVKINVDNCQSLMKKYGVRSLPTIVFLSQDANGMFKENFKKIGSMDQSSFLETVRKVYE
jgi:thioredoxin 1